MIESTESRPTAKMRVLFACVGNTCRSLMAEFITRRMVGDILEPSSAGFQPGNKADAENAIYTLKRLFGIDASAHTPRRIARADVEGADLVVAMDGAVARQVRQEFPDYPLDHLVEWKIADPYGDDLEEYEQCALAMFRELKKLIPTQSPSLQA